MQHRALLMAATGMIASRAALAIDFSQYLSKPTGELKVSVLPEGHYFATIKGEPTTKESTNGKPMLVWKFAITGADEDVDQSLLPDGRIPDGKSITYNNMLDNEYGLADVGNVLRATGIEMDDARGFGEYLDQVDNLPVKLFLTNRARDKDDPNSPMIEDIKKVLPAG